MDISQRILDTVKIKGKTLGEVIPQKEEVQYVKGDIGFVVYNSHINEKMHDIFSYCWKQGSLYRYC